MAITYQQLLHDVAIRLSALVGTQVAALAASYDTAVLTAAQFKSADWPFNSFRDAVLMAEEDFAWAIADSGNHPWRANIGSTTAVLVSGASLPANDNTGSKIIGAYGSVYDTTDGLVCTEAPRNRVLLINRLGTGVPEYLYCIDSRRIIHTRISVTIDVCIYNRDVRLAAFIANGAMLLPDVLELAIVSRAISLLTKDGAFESQAKIYAEYAGGALDQIRKGFSSIDSKALPREERVA